MKLAQIVGIVCIVGAVGCRSDSVPASRDGSVRVTAGEGKTLKHRAASEILAISDDTEFAIAMSDLVFAREQAVGYAALTPAERVVFCLDALEREINNGGFQQFFENSSGDHAFDTVESLQTLGANQMAALVRDAIAVFPGGRPAADRGERQDQLDRLDQRATSRWGELDDAFYQYPDNLVALERRYVQQHVAQFSAP